MGVGASLSWCQGLCSALGSSEVVLRRFRSEKLRSAVYDVAGTVSMIPLVGMKACHLWQRFSWSPLPVVHNIGQDPFANLIGRPHRGIHVRAER